jgi:hypothetical protein
LRDQSLIRTEDVLEVRRMLDMLERHLEAVIN